MFLVIKNQIIGKITRERVTTASVSPSYKRTETQNNQLRINIIVNLPTIKLKGKNIIFV